ncbi:Uncharacterised protein [Mycobacteroides abscessus subsp. abscessus]|nr:Uncharacterised protein [Mycobacteroides abscessus subsp. abscessus]SLE97275.1 Uncharacterised protein [Mycobacteroides abscessus subsp. abscessus]
MPSNVLAAEDGLMSESNTVPPWVNKVVRGVLRSPLHPVLSGNIALFTFTGRKSGKEYNVAATYVRDGDVLTIFTDRTWAKNLRDGRPVTAPWCAASGSRAPLNWRPDRRSRVR